MCYYNGIRVSKADFIRLKGIEKELKGLRLNRPVGNGFDYQDWPIIKPTIDRKNFEIIEAHWELIPPSILDEIDLANARKGGIPWLNAKAENLFKNERGGQSMWAHAARTGRCLVLSSGFFEFRHIPKLGKKGQELKTTDKVPYYITLKDRPEFFFMAGISQLWTNHARNQSAETFAIVTRPANEFMAEVHNSAKRMPAILTQELAEEWLKGSLPEERITEIALSNTPAGEMIAWPVAPDFKNKKNPEEPFDYPNLPPLLYNPN